MTGKWQYTHVKGQSAFYRGILLKGGAKWESSSTVICRSSACPAKAFYGRVLQIFTSLCILAGKACHVTCLSLDCVSGTGAGEQTYGNAL